MSVRNDGRIIAAVGAVTTLAGALIYAGSAAEMVFYRLATDGLVLLAWLASAAALGAFILRIGTRIIGDENLTEPRRSPLLHGVTAAATGLGLFSLATLGLGMLGWLTQATAIAMLTTGALLGALVLFLNSRRRKAAEKRLLSTTPNRSAWTWLGLAAVPFCILVIVATMVPAGLLWSPQEPHGYDVIEYHMQVPREWYEAGRIVPLRHNVFSFLPMGVEMHYLLAMRLDGGPWEGMYLAQLMHAALIALTALAACGVASGIAPTRASALLAAIVLITLPWLTQLAPIAYNEGGFLLYGTLAVGWAMRATLDPSPAPRRRLAWFLGAGAMAGFACGTKLTAVPEILLAAAAVSFIVGWITRSQHDGPGARLWRASRHPERSEGSPEPEMLRSAQHDGVAMSEPPNGRVRPPHDGKSGRRRLIFTGPLALLAAGLLTFSPWLLRNQIWAHNPLFPEAAGLLGRAHFSDVQIERWHRANHFPRPDQAGPGRHLLALWDEVLGGWQFGYVLLPLSIVALVAARRRPAAWFLGGMLLVLTVFWIGFTHLQGRFFLLAAPLAAMLIAQVDWGRWHIPVVAVVLLAALAGWWRLNRHVAGVVRGSPQHPGGIADAMGRSQLDWLLPEAMDAFPKGEQLILVGEARAFLYQIPMSRLQYRTVFDADTSAGRGISQAWAADSGHPWVLVDPAELRRFAKTYQPFPPLPPEQDRGETAFWLRSPAPKPIAPSSRGW